MAHLFGVFLLINAEEIWDAKLQFCIPNFFWFLPISWLSAQPSLDLTCYYIALILFLLLSRFIGVKVSKYANGLKFIGRKQATYRQISLIDTQN